MMIIEEPLISLTDPSSELLPPTAYIGIRSDSSHYFNGYLAAVECCSFLKPAKNVYFPNYSKILIIKSQYVDDDDERVERSSTC